MCICKSAVSIQDYVLISIILLYILYYIIIFVGAGGLGSKTFGNHGVQSFIIDSNTGNYIFVVGGGPIKYYFGGESSAHGSFNGKSGLLLSPYTGGGTYFASTGGTALTNGIGAGSGGNGANGFVQIEY